MKKIKYEDIGSILNPLKSLQFFARKPVTEPLEPREAAEIYRGFHLNDMEKCIGCSTCQKICDNAAITMVKVPHLKEDPVNGIRNLRPAIDYGRCCWCALCVDICPTGAIELSREYVHICNGDEVDSYFILPQELGIHGTEQKKGWTKTPVNDLLDRKRTDMGEMPAEARVDNFQEIVAGYTAEQAVLEASRCVQCGMCHDSCPTHMHAPEYIRAIWKGNVEEAVEWMYETNPFSHVCGRVCTHRCETACSLNQTGLPEGSEPIAIRWLKRYAMDAVPHERIKEIVARKKATTQTGKTIAIIGAGPAGLTTAFDLVKQGHAVQVFEALPKGGGMTRYGIPYYRLPDDSLERDIDVIQSMGVKIQYNTCIGEQISMSQLQADYDAVVIAIGLQAGRSTRIPGSEHKDTRSAVELLRIIADESDSAEQPGFTIPERAVVIGGGNVAMDIARSLARYQKQKFNQVDIVLTAIDELAQFPADKEEIKESLEEGIIIIPSRGPQEVLIKNDKVTGLKTWRVESIFDKDGRFSPRYDESDEQIYNAQMVIEAIGQMAEVETLLGESLTEELDWERGRIKITEDGSTSVAWLWSAGDCVNGPDVVHAVADGHRVADSINEYLMKQTETNG